MAKNINIHAMHIKIWFIVCIFPIVENTDTERIIKSCILVWNWTCTNYFVKLYPCRMIRPLLCPAQNTKASGNYDSI